MEINIEKDVKFSLVLVVRAQRGMGGGGNPTSKDGSPLNGRSSHLIEAAKRGRLDQMIFFSAPLTTLVPPGRSSGRPAERTAERPTERPTERPVEH